MKIFLEFLKEEVYLPLNSTRHILRRHTGIQPDGSVFLKDIRLLLQEAGRKREVLLNHECGRLVCDINMNFIIGHTQHTVCRWLRLVISKETRDIVTAYPINGQRNGHQINKLS